MQSQINPTLFMFLLNLKLPQCRLIVKTPLKNTVCSSNIFVMKSQGQINMDVIGYPPASSLENCYFYGFFLLFAKPDEGL